MSNIEAEEEKIKGLTFVAPPEPFARDPIEDILKINADWIAIIPYAFTAQGKPSVRYSYNSWQWWGERPEGIIETIRLAKKSKISVMLKPQVYIHGSWVGDMEFQSEEDWLKWEQEYKSYISTMVKIAKDEAVEMFCIGTEFNKSVKKRPAFWNDLIKDIRKNYTGKLTYSANWDHYEEVPFWSDLDYIGISAYFPLNEDKNPNKETLLKAWMPIKEKLKQFSEKNKKQILFTEYGYLSVDGCAGKLWELEPIATTLAINQDAQATSLDALYQTFWNESFWAGGFLWKWFPLGEGHEGYVERDYDPQNKKAAVIINSWFGK